MATYKELRAQIDELRRQANEARLAEQAVVLDQIRTLIIEHKLLPSDLGLGMPSKRRTTSVAAKYRDPSTGATWSGRGRTPKWIQGDDRTKYEV